VCPSGAFVRGEGREGREVPRRLLEKLFDAWFGDDGDEL
jgi:hypothetical protein